MKLSIIVVNYQSQDYLKNLLGTILTNSSLLDYEVIVVNNDDKNPSLILPFTKGENFKVINSGGNIGFGRANNLGAEEARGEVLLFLNPDTEIISGNWEDAIKEIGEDRDIGVMGVKLITKSGETQKWIAGRETNVRNLIRNNLGFSQSRKIWESQEKKECDWVSGAALFIKKELFQKLGGFDEKFFMYFEDEDLCKRARQQGYKIIYYPEFIIKHLGGKSFKNKKEQKKYYYASQDYYFQKHFGKFTGFGVRALRKIFS